MTIFNNYLNINPSISIEIFFLNVISKLLFRWQSKYFHPKYFHPNVKSRCSPNTLWFLLQQMKTRVFFVESKRTFSLSHFFSSLIKKNYCVIWPSRFIDSRFSCLLFRVSIMDYLYHTIGNCLGFYKGFFNTRPWTFRI